MANTLSSLIVVLILPLPEVIENGSTEAIFFELKSWVREDNAVLEEYAEEDNGSVRLNITVEYYGAKATTVGELERTAENIVKEKAPLLWATSRNAA